MMKLEDLKKRIEESLNLEVITKDSLITCVNNCFADIHSRGYKEVTEKEQKITSNSFPVSISLPEEYRSMNYVKVITDTTSETVERISLGEPGYLGRIDHEGNTRIQLDMASTYKYYIVKNHLYIDGRTSAPPIRKVVFSYLSKLQKIPFDTELSKDIPIRHELEDALVFYGMYFFGQRIKMDVEFTKEHLNRYRYFVQDTLDDLWSEDMYINGRTVESYGDFNG